MKLITSSSLGYRERTVPARAGRGRRCAPPVLLAVVLLGGVVVAGVRLPWR